MVTIPSQRFDLNTPQPSGAGMCWVAVPREFAWIYQAAYEAAMRRVIQEQLMEAAQDHLVAVALSN